MEELTINNLNNFSLFGLRQICSYNRDFLYNFNKIPRKQLIALIQTRLKENHTILIPPFVFKDNKYLLSQYKVM